MTLVGWLFLILVGGVVWCSGLLRGKTEEERNRFQLLRRAFTEARYEPGYHIEKEDLNYLADRVHRLQEAVNLLCEQRIAKYEKKAQA